MSMPRPDDESKQFFAFIMPGDPRIQVRPMFGNLASFINGNMFAGLFGTQIFVRLPEAERVQLIEVEGAAAFSPMEGRPMKEYITLPDRWRDEPDKVSAWMERSLEWVGAMPEKTSAKKQTTKKKTKDK